MQALPEAHATPNSALVPAGFGVAWTAHLVPFHRSARVWEAPALLK